MIKHELGFRKKYMNKLQIVLVYNLKYFLLIFLQWFKQFLNQNSDNTPYALKWKIDKLNVLVVILQPSKVK